MSQKNSNHGEWRFVSPLRYPGGKGELANFIKLLLDYNRLHDVHYMEPYCGGAALGLSLLYEEYARTIRINDLNRGVFAFWHSVLFETEALCERIRSVPVTIAEWERQRSVLTGGKRVHLLDLGFAAFFLNRTNRSGIIGAGVIGGKNQTGNWKIDARFRRDNLISRIRKAARYRSRITLTNSDAERLLADMVPQLPHTSLLYLDPPYYVKGVHLYEDHYTEQDHARIADVIQALDCSWVVSYDYHPRLLDLYADRRCLVYQLSYHAQDRYKGREVIFFSDNLKIPTVTRPTRITIHDVVKSRRMRS